MTINKKFNRAMSIALLVLIGLVPKFVLTKCTQPTGTRPAPPPPQTNLEFVNQWLENGGTVTNSVTGQTAQVSSFPIMTSRFRSLATENPELTLEELEVLIANHFIPPATNFVPPFLEANRYPGR